MDIKIPSEPSSVRAASVQVGDLLSQLRVAGTVEARVVKLLNENQLLLNTRLGQILTSSTLDYRAGDRIKLRLDESSGQAVLKASSVEIKPLKLDSREFPQLARALPPDRPLLARVVRITARNAEIRLVDQIVNLPRELPLVKNQLLSLQRRDGQRNIEIRVLENKAIYKAVLKQLLPRQVRTREPALIRLLEFARLPQNAVRTARAATAPSRPEFISAAQRDAVRAPIPAVKTVPTGAANTATATPGIQSLSAATAPATGIRSTATDTGIAGLAARPKVRGAGLGPAPTASKIVQETLPADKTGNRIQPSGLVAGSRPGLASIPASTPASNAVTPTHADAGAKTTSAEVGHRHGNVLREPSNGIKGASKASPGQARQTAAIAGTPAVNPVGANPVTAGVGITTATTLPALQPLLQLVTALANLDAPQIKKWFEFARLIRAVPNAGQVSAGGDIFRLLQPLAQSEGFNRELAQTPAQKSAGPGGGEPAPQKSNAQEAQLLQLREAASRLVDQSLSQNLLQRATLGMQQETQQPLNLSLALPFIDQQQLRTVYIDLSSANRRTPRLIAAGRSALTSNSAGWAASPATCCSKA